MNKRKTKRIDGQFMKIKNKVNQHTTIKKSCSQNIYIYVKYYYFNETYQLEKTYKTEIK